MNSDEHEPQSIASQQTAPLSVDVEAAPRPWAVFAILLVAILVAEVSKDVLIAVGLDGWWLIVLAGVPFLLARIAPKAAGFDTQWLPNRRRQWFWFLGMVLVLFVSRALVLALAAATVGQPVPPPATTSPTPARVLLLGTVIVFLGPLAEEVFFRGYLLEQFRKLVRPSNALLIQALLFGLWHLYGQGWSTSWGWTRVVNAFFMALILGAWRIKFRSLLPLVFAHVLFNATTIPYLMVQYERAVDRTCLRHCTISKETTYITEPLLENGAPDYVAVLNERSSKGVTPENNSAVLFWKAVGPREIQPDYREKYFEMLGIPALPAEGEYYVNLAQYLARQVGDVNHGNAESQSSSPPSPYDLLEPALKRPWSKQEFPMLADWLAINEKPLALLVEASKRPRRYDQLVCGKNVPLIAILYPALSVYHEAGDIISVFVARAMLRLAEGKTEEAWKDLLTCHRLARLVSQGPTMMDAMVSQGRESRSCSGELALLQHTRLTTAQIAKMREDLGRLPAMPPIADKLDAAERFTCLNVVLDCSRDAHSSLADFAKTTDQCTDLIGDLKDSPFGVKNLKTVMEWLLHYSADTEIDWDLALREVNSWFDRLADAYRRPTRTAQNEALLKLNDDFGSLKKTVDNVDLLHQSMLGDRRKALSERVAQVILVMLLPPIALKENRDACGAVTFDMTKLAFALAAYHADHGSYPEKLAGLMPKYIRKVPLDPHSNAELRYRQDGKGYVLYSVGLNGRDDGGRGFDDRVRGKECHESDWDDLVIRMPAPATR
jgi:membrane protease YdiL (CAAX protease family)